MPFILDQPPAIIRADLTWEVRLDGFLAGKGVEPFLRNAVVAELKRQQSLPGKFLKKPLLKATLEDIARFGKKDQQYLLSVLPGTFAPIANYKSPFAITFVTSGVANGTVTTSWNVGSQSIGAAPNAGDTRYVIVVCSGTAGATRTVSSCTIGGNAATQAVVSSAAFHCTGIFYLSVSSGTTATIVIVINNNVSSVGFGIYRMINPTSGTPTATNSATGSGSLTLNVNSSGAIVGVAANRGGGGSTWSGITEDFDTDTDPANNRNINGGHGTASGTPVSVSNSGGSNGSGCTSSWA